MSRPAAARSEAAYLVAGTPGENTRVTFSLAQRRASFRNEFGLFLVDDTAGRIGNLRPGDRGYAAAALGRRQAIFRPGQKPGTITTLTLPGGRYFATYLIQDATAKQLLRSNPHNQPGRRAHAFFSFTAANPDHFTHVRRPNANVMKWEDLLGGGDRDFNDAVVRFQYVPHQPNPGPTTGPANPGPANGPGNSGAGTGPAIVAALARDTAPDGQTNSDGITSDPTVAGTVNGASPIRVLRAGFDATSPASFLDVTSALQPGGTFRFDPDRMSRINGAPLADGRHTLHLQAADDQGKSSGLFDLAFTLDTHAPLVTIQQPPPGSTVDHNVTVVGTVTDPTSPVVRLQNRVDQGAFSDAPLGASGSFQYTTTLPLDGSADGVRTVGFVATDAAGNVASPVAVSLTLSTGGFLDGLDDWATAQTGGSEAGKGEVTLVPVNGGDKGALLREGDSFNVTLAKTFIVPQDPGKLRFDYASLDFDTAAQGMIKDAFEVALVDPSGQPLVHPFTTNRDAFFNISENVPTAAGSETTINGQTVMLDLSGVAPGTQATLIFRLVNNDSDQTTSVIITGARLPAGASVVSPGTVTASASSPAPSAAFVASAPLVQSAASLEQALGNGGSQGTGGSSSATDPSQAQPPDDSGTPYVTDPNDPRSWQGATVGTFAQLIYGSDTLENRQKVVDSKLLVAGLFDVQDTTPAKLIRLGGSSSGASTDLTGAGGYGYTLGTVDYVTAGSAIDNAWIQTSGTIGETVWDLGAPSTKAAIFPTIDHGPLPQESLEVTAYLSNDLVHWTQAVFDRVWLEGFYPNLGVQWDGFSFAVGTADNAPFRYVSLTWGGPGALWSDGDDEINGVLGLRTDYTPAIQPPAITIDSPVDESTFAAGSTIVVSGQALGSGDGSVPITQVTINGQNVDVLDPSGRFFARITVSPGENALVFQATQKGGLKSSATLNVEGAASSRAKVDFTNLSDISASFQPGYARTSFQDSTHLLYSDVTIQNAGQYPVDAPLYVGITNISDPRVHVANPAGVTPRGIPYVDFSGLVTGGRLSPGGETGQLNLVFSDPNLGQFTYDLVFFGLLNRAPEFTTIPRVEALAGRSYGYHSGAADPDAEPVTYTLVSGPAAMTVDPATGVVSWAPSSDDIGTTDVVIQASDGRGGTATQRYTLSVIVPPPNRPPVFTSVPVVSANVHVPYAYQATADDPDGDPLTFSIVAGPSGLVIAPDTGAISWTPTADQLDDQSVTVAVADGRGGTATQDFVIRVAMEPGNHAPVIVSQPVLSVKVSDVTGSSLLGNGGFETPVVPRSSYNTYFVGESFLAPWEITDGSVEPIGNLYWPSNEGGQSLDLNGGGPGTIQQSFSTTAGQTYSLDFAYGNNPGGSGATAEVTVLGVTTLLSQTISHTGSTFAEIQYSQFHQTFIADSSTTTIRFRGLTGALFGIVLDAVTVTTVTSAYVYDSSALDPDDDSVTYSLVQGPTGMTIDPGTGVISWQPTSGDMGQHPVTVRVADGRGGFDEQSFVVDVEDTSTTPKSDLTVSQVDRSGLAFDGQLLTVSGSITAHIDNQGAAAASHPFDVLFFEDRDFDQKYTPNVDVVLGSTRVVTPIAAGQGLDVSADLSGTTLFAGSMIWAFVDSGNAIDESNETNNLANTCQGCTVTPPPGEFDPVVEWKKDTFSVEPASNQVMMTPAVVDLDGDGIPDIVFSTFSGGGYSGGGILRAIRGSDGTELWSVTDSQYSVVGAANIAVGDIDGDGRPEIIAVRDISDLIAFEHDGSFKWRSPATTVIQWGGPAIADLDHDGLPEIIIGATVLNNDGSIRWSGSGGQGDGAVGPLSVVADLDLDGSPEVVAGRTAYRADGTVYWNAPIADAFPAVGNFNDDPYPELVMVRSPGITLLDHLGQVIWGPVTIPGGGGGAPTIADMDGDGRPEIGVAGSIQYTVFETDGSIKWSSPIQDHSSAVTGSSVFDFDSDGQAEVVYGDEQFLRIYRGSDGAVLYQVPRSSGTAYEYPVIADVDADGKAEIVVPANDYAFGNVTGILVIGDRNNTWAPTRQIWNEHTYHITNVNDDGTIPRSEANSWQLYDSYRLNTLPGFTGAQPAPDLVGSYVRIAEGTDTHTITARIGNVGALFVGPGVNVAFYEGDPQSGGVLLGTAQTTTRLEPGQYEDITLTIPARLLTDVWLSVDDDGTGHGVILECNEQNNVYQSSTGLPSLNHLPVFTSQPVTSGTLGQLYRYDVDATDDDPGDVLTYSLRAQPPGMVIDPASGVITWTPGTGYNGRHLIQVVVSDGRGGRAVQLVPIDVAGSTANSSPTFTSTAPVQGMIGQDYRYGATAFDPEGDALTFELVVKPDGMAVDPATGTVVWNPAPNQVGTFDVILRVQDGQGGVDLQSFQVMTTQPNTPPTITSAPPGPTASGVPYQYLVRAQDPNGDAIAYRLDAAPSGMAIDAATGLLSWPVTQAGTQHVVIVADDGHGGIARQTFDLPVIAGLANTPPTIGSQAPTAGRLGSRYRYQVLATDHDGDPLSYHLDTFPAGMTMSAGGFISWTPGPDQLGAGDVTVRVEDGRGGFKTQSFTVTVSTTTENADPTIVSNPRLAGIIGKAYRYDATAADPEGDPLVWSLDTVPAGMSIDPTTGSVRWTPGASQLGPQAVVVSVVDARGGSATQSFTITVRAVNTPPTIVSTAPTQGYSGSPYLYAVRAIDADGDPLTFSVTGPPAMAIDATGLIQWTPTAADVAVHQIIVKVSDGVATATQVFDLDVASTTASGAPLITSTPAFVAGVGEAYTYPVKAVDPDGDIPVYSLLSSPAGMTIDAATGLVSWAPDASQLGPQSVTVAAADPAGNVATQTYTVTVRPANQSPVINSHAPATVTAGQTYRYDLRASDPDGDRLSFRLAQSPAGMTIDTNLGRIAWPTTTAAIGGVHVQVVASDGRGGEATESFDLGISADTNAPRVSITASPNPVDLGKTTVLVVAASDDVGVKGVTLTFDGVAVPVDASGQARVPAGRVGLVPAVATVTDAAGNVGTATINVTVSDPSDAEAPVVSIAAPDDDAVITAPVPVTGTVSDTNLTDYSLELQPVAGGAAVVIARGTTNVTDGTLGTLDPSRFANDAYILRLVAHDAGGHTSIDERIVSFAGNLKLGNFTLSFTDLTVPVSGIPITVSRTYDTLTSSTSGDFGYGWRLEFGNTDLRISVAKTGEEADGLFNAFRDKTRVYVTLPGGQREGFTFQPRLAPGLRGSFLGIYQAKFVPDSGVTDSLSVDYFDLARFTDGTYGDYSGSLPYNPADPAFGGTFTLTTKEGIVYTIDGLSGKLRNVVDRNGNALEFTSAGISSKSGEKVTFERDPQGRITAVVDPMGGRITYQYDGHGDLVSVADRTGGKTQFVYRTDRAHYLDQVIDPLGHTGVRSEYDDQGRLVRIIDASGNPVRLQYDPDHSTETTYDQLGNATVYEYDERGNVLTEVDALGGITTHTYDANNNELTTTDPLGHTTTRIYDAAGNVLTETDPLGLVTRTTYDSHGNVLSSTDPLGQTTTNTYDSRGNLLEMRDASGKVTQLAYDSAGNPTSISDSTGTLYQFAYDSSGNVASQTDALGNTTVNTYDGAGHVLTETRALTTPSGVRTLVTRTEYDAEGRAVKVTDAEGGVTRAQYNAAGQKVATIDALGRTTQYVYDDRGQLVTTILPDGTRTSTEYDAAGRSIATIDAAGRRTEMHYDTLGRLVETIYPDATPGSSTDNPRTQTVYDAAGQQIAAIDELGHRTEFTYDADGRQTIVRDAMGNETRTTYDDAGRSVATTDALGHTTQFVHDAASRPVEIDYADGTSTSSQFDSRGRVIARTDQLGRTTHYEYDAADHLVAVVDALGQRTTYGYNELGNLVTQTDANGHVTRYEYDGRGRRTATVLPIGQRSTTTYDAVGNVTSTTDFNGQTITFAYDSRNRLLAKHYPDGSSVAFTDTPTGQRQTVVDARGTTSYEYDARDRLISRTDPDGTTISYTYDLAGNRTAVTIPAGTTTYTFDALNRLATATDPDLGVARYTYDANSNLIKTERPDGTVETRGYDALGHLLSIDDRAPDGSVIESFQYTLAPTGRRDSVVEQDGRTVNYQYDLLDRLTEEAIKNADGSTRTIDYTYDPVGNRLTRVDSAEGETDYTYDANDRLLTETLGSQVTRYTYDNNGNTLSKFTSAVDQALYEWDADNRLVGATVTDSSGTTHAVYRYDADGIRVASTVNGDEARYLIDTVQPYAQVVEEYTPGGIITVSYVYGNDQISQNRSGAKSFYHVDGLGSTRALTNSSGVVTDRYLYDAFGRTIGQVGVTGNVYLFAGEQRDAAVGLDYLRARYLDSATGRFVSRDAFDSFRRNPLTLHRYLYGNSSPTSFVDPSGQFSLAEVMVTLNVIGVLASAAELMIIYSRQVPPPPSTQLTATQCAVVKQMLAYEAANGTWETALRFSNTAGDTPMGPEFDNKPVPTAAGVMDLDWYTDVMLFSGGAAGIPLPLGTYVAYGTYFGGKLAWNVGRKAIGLYEGVTTNVAWWFSDPKEASALRAYLNNYKTYASLFPSLPC